MKKVLVAWWLFNDETNEVRYALSERGLVQSKQTKKKYVEGEIVSETEKAYKVKYDTDYGTIIRFAPKSQTIVL